MRTFFRLILCGLLLTACGVLPASAEGAPEGTTVIDVPTTGMLDYGTYDLNFRLFSDGGVLSRLNFGVFKIVNLGIGWELEKVIGSQNIVVGPPALYIKLRPYAGGMVLPAFAIGYDGQGYFYDKDKKEYLQKEKGVFMVFGREIFVPGLEINAGANMNDFSTNRVFGFTSLTLNLEDKFIFLSEYDNVNYIPDARLNAGVRFFLTPDLSIDLAGRDLIGENRSAERIIRVNYQGKF